MVNFRLNNFTSLFSWDIIPEIASSEALQWSINGRVNPGRLSCLFFMILDFYCLITSVSLPNHLKLEFLISLLSVLVSQTNAEYKHENNLCGQLMNEIF